MVKHSFIPDKGDLVWLNFNPQAGREQARNRPALILTAQPYNQASGLAVACPITSRVKGYPFEVRLPDGLPISGVILVDCLKSLDWNERQVALISKAPPEVLAQVLEKVAVLLEI